MMVDTFTLEIDRDGIHYVCQVIEHSYEGILSYEILIDEPEGFTSYNEIEQPLSMKYDTVTGELKIDSIQDLSFLHNLETALSDAINMRNNHTA